MRLITYHKQSNPGIWNGEGLRTSGNKAIVDGCYKYHALVVSSFHL